MATSKINSDGVLTAPVARWHYPATDGKPTAGAVVQLLTRGGMQVKGVWTDDGRFIAWAPNLQRDKELEERLGLF